MLSRRPEAIVAWLPKKNNLETTLRVGVEDAIATLDVGLAGGDAGGSSKLLVLGQGVGRVEVLVDDTGHAVLAVAARGLAAVVPDRGTVLHDDLEDFRVLAVVGGEEAREEGVGVLWLAGLAERGLDDRVYGELVASSYPGCD